MHHSLQSLGHFLPISLVGRGLSLSCGVGGRQAGLPWIWLWVRREEKINCYTYGASWGLNPASSVKFLESANIFFSLTWHTLLKASQGFPLFLGSKYSELQEPTLSGPCLPGQLHCIHGVLFTVPVMWYAMGPLHMPFLFSWTLAFHTYST
uniref:Uncharacterized protein n=1 Tax=Cebus imitator TaxID=2715852 RepID=A0A2K5R978_CEBIM